MLIFIFFYLAIPTCLRQTAIYTTTLGVTDYVVAPTYYQDGGNGSFAPTSATMGTLIMLQFRSSFTYRERMYDNFPCLTILRVHLMSRIEYGTCNRYQRTSMLESTLDRQVNSTIKHWIECISAGGTKLSLKFRCDLNRFQNL